MTTSDKMVRQFLAVSYEHILTVGEESVLNELKTMGDVLRTYPHVWEKVKKLDEQREAGLLKEGRAEDQK